MPSASHCSIFLVGVTLATAGCADTLPPAPAAPVARLQMTPGLYDLPTPARTPRFRLPDARDFLPDILGLGAGLMSGDRISTQAEITGSGAGAPRVDLSIGFNF